MKAARHPPWAAGFGFVAAAWIVPACGSDEAPGVNPVPTTQGTAAAGHDASTDHDSVALGSAIDPKRIYHDVAVLSSDCFGGRLPGTVGGELALDYVETLFRQIGLREEGTQGYRWPFSFLQ